MNVFQGWSPTLSRFHLTFLPGSTPAPTPLSPALFPHHHLPSEPLQSRHCPEAAALTISLADWVLPRMSCLPLGSNLKSRPVCPLRLCHWLSTLGPVTLLCGMPLLCIQSLQNSVLSWTALPTILQASLKHPSVLSASESTLYFPRASKQIPVRTYLLNSFGDRVHSIAQAGLELTIS